MSPFLRIPLGLLIIASGIHMVFKTDFYEELVGAIPFAEDKFGIGGTKFFLKLIGVGVCFIGIAVATNLISDMLGGFAGVFIH